ncbi:hypothetical protein E1I69_09045 [Bacillus timonensis]|uniref:Uncharacterized protein n=1 Tax=Bacillus timonensis TaxID=1033734 RepID=A0A4S3PTG3_9BACI|nr:hypothetical protein [Bacillus timonensis]THE13009.1 hypothetical protein E1I69_09045 [Bacillus timonensis]
MRLFFKKVTSSVWGEELNPSMDRYSKTTRIVMGALLGSIAVIFQSAGIFTGIGYIMSMMSTGPLVLASLMSLRIGVMTYFVTIFLLTLLQPSELLVFMFTTGLLGLSLGIGLKYLKKSKLIILFAGACLTLGISILLYVLKFPILGPSVTSHFNSMVVLGTFAFSLLYCWIWKVVSIYVFKVLHPFFLRR